jgi:hypothetical protein
MGEATSIVPIRTRMHDAEKVLADFQRILKEEPEDAADGCVVLMLSRGEDGDSYNIRTLSSDMRYMEVATLLEGAKYNMLKQVMG